MRVAVFVVFASVLTTPLEASQSCMTKAEARQHFGSVHIYWHGTDHCWDATSARRYHRIRHAQDKIDRPVQQKNDQPKDPVKDPVKDPPKDPVKVQANDPVKDQASNQSRNEPKNQSKNQSRNQPKWHEAMSEMLPDEESVQSPWTDRWVTIETPPIVSRWVDINQVVPPPAIEKTEPMVTPTDVVMVIIVITMTLAIVMILQGRPPAGRATRF
jgi:hypothetical protein